MVGVLGAAAACARLMQVPAPAIPHVMGIAASLASRLYRQFRDHDQAAALPATQRATACSPRHSARRATPPIRRRSKGATGYFQTFCARHRRVATTASRISAAATISSAGVTASSRIRAAGSRTPASRPRSTCATRVAGRLDAIKSIHCGVSRAGRPARIDRLSLGHRAGEVQRRLSGALCAGARRAADRRVHRKGARRRPPQGDPAEDDRRCRSRARPPAGTTAPRRSASRWRTARCSKCARISRPARSSCRCRRRSSRTSSTTARLS